jgi:SpoVK/Ycf46/Vps4 family AAA+-type ATPase
MVNNTEEKKPYTFAKGEKYLLDLVTSALEGNATKSEMASLNLSRVLRSGNPDLSEKIRELLSIYSMHGSAAMRHAGSPPPPVDTDSHIEMATIIPPDIHWNKLLVLGPAVRDRIDSFLEERSNVHLLLENNIRPSNSLLLIGPSGTGKTLLAHYLASRLNKNLVILDLSSAISSLLGKTGHNLKKVLQYARQHSSVLLLDEFDAIAKKRDDNTDLGEIKRVVNVLLMELEDWPTSSIVIATSNHPELLDKAIWRRFDHTIEVNLPELAQRQELLTHSLKTFYVEQHAEVDMIPLYAELLAGSSAADICKFSNNVKRKILIKKENPVEASLNELMLFTRDKKIKAKVCKIAKEKLKLSIRDIAKLTSLSPAGVQHHLKN